MSHAILACPIQPFGHLSNNWERVKGLLVLIIEKKKLEWSEIIISSRSFDLKIRGISTETKKISSSEEKK